MGNRVDSMLLDEEINVIREETGFTAAQIDRLYSRFKSLDKSGIGSLSRQDFIRIPELAINPLCDQIVNMFFVDCDEDHDRINFRQFMKVLATFRSSSKPTRSRNASRQESIQTILSSLSQNRYRHSRHSSCDGFFNYYPVQHHTTNQHSIHYVASITHLPSAQHHHHAGGSHLSNNNNLMGNNNNLNPVSTFKKPLNPLLDPDEPANSRKQKLYFMFKIYDMNNDNLISLDDLTRILKIMVGNYISETKVLELAARTLKQADKNLDGYIDFDEFCTAFLHRDIDETLRVKFATQPSDHDTNNNKSNIDGSNNKNKPR